MDLSEAIEYLTPIAESAQVGHYGEALSTVLKAIQDTSQYYGLCTKAGHENCELFPFNAEWGIIHHPKKETPVNIKEEIVRTLSEQETLHDLATALIPLIRRAHRRSADVDRSGMG